MGLAEIRMTHFDARLQQNAFDQTACASHTPRQAAAGGSLPALLTLSCLLPLSLHKQGSVMGLQM